MYYNYQTTRSVAPVTAGVTWGANMEYNELDPLLNQLKSLKGQDITTREQRVSLLARLAHKARRAAFRESFILTYEKLKSGHLPEESEKRPVKSGDLADLHKFKPRGKQQARREVIAQEICEILFEDIDNPFAIDSETPLNARRLWPQDLIRIYNLYKDKSLQDFNDPKVPSRWECSGLPEPYRTEWLDSIEGGSSELSASIGSTLLHWIDRRRDEKNWQIGRPRISLWHDLETLQPPLTWGELMWHCVYYLNDSERKERLKELDKYFSPDRHCIICGQIFKISKYNPGHVRCPRCSRNIRARRYREKNRNESRRYD